MSTRHHSVDGKSSHQEISDSSGPPLFSAQCGCHAFQCLCPFSCSFGFLAEAQTGLKQRFDSTAWAVKYGFHSTV